MSKHIELPLIEPLYKTYQYQGPSTAVAVNNPSIINWHLNEIMSLTCGRRFLKGFTTPELTIADSSWEANPYLEKKRVSMEFTKGYINPIIREMLDKGYYVSFNGVDDYYVKGKSWYKRRHIDHDGIICGYDQKDKTYCIYSYDSNFLYRKYWISQRDFNVGRKFMMKNGVIGSICAIKVKNEKIDFSPKKAYEKLKEYLDSNLEKYPFDGEGRVYGMVVHKYIAEYVDRLHKGEIPYERMDWRVFRQIWEHKKIMLERIVLIEKSLNLSSSFSERYRPLVAQADTIRMLYASHHKKRRDSVLPIIQKNLLEIMTLEQEILSELTEKMGKVL